MFESLMKSLIGSVWITRFNKNFSVKIVLQLKIPHESRNIVNGKLIVKFKTAKYSTDCGAQLVAEDSLVGSSPPGQGPSEEGLKSPSCVAYVVTGNGTICNVRRPNRYETLNEPRHLVDERMGVLRIFKAENQSTKVDYVFCSRRVGGSRRKVHERFKVESKNNYKRVRDWKVQD